MALESENSTVDRFGVFDDRVGHILVVLVARVVRDSEGDDCLPDALCEGPGALRLPARLICRALVVGNIRAVI